MQTLTKEQLEFLGKHELCRLATASADGWPHAVPVIYALDGEDVIIAVDYGTKKLKNLRENSRVALVVDEYGSSGGNRGLMLQGPAEIFERGPEYLRLLKVLFDRFDFYRQNPWGEGESPIVRVRPSKCVMW
jgi:PPOX class probable F420-dependent enzyme